MNTLANLQSSYTTGLWIVNLILLGIFLTRFIMVIRNRNERKWLFQWKRQWMVWVLKLVFAIAMVFLIIAIPTWFMFLSAFRRIVPAFLNNAFIFLWLCIAFQELVLCTTASKALCDAFIKRILFLMVSIFCFLGFGVSALMAGIVFNYPPTQDCVLLDLPVHGRWTAGHAGGDASVNYHCDVPAQKYAMDISKLNQDGNYFTGDGSRVNDFVCFNDSVFAPAAGVVVTAFDSLQNQQVLKGRDSVHPAGNHIVLDIGNGHYVFLAHLNRNTILVHAGDTVQAGQYLANVGNSGNTTWPHLHMHVANCAGLRDKGALGVPYRFKHLQRKRFLFTETVENEYLIRNDIFSN